MYSLRGINYCTTKTGGGPSGHGKSYENVVPPGSLSGCVRFERHPIPEPLQGPDMPTFQRVPIALEEIIGPRLFVGGPALEHVVRAHQDAVAHRHHRILPAEPGIEAPGLGAHIRAFAARGALRGFEQRG